MWTIDGEFVIEQLAGIEDFQLAMATYRAACRRWPGAAITLRQGAKVIEDNRRERTAKAARSGNGTFVQNPQGLISGLVKREAEEDWGS